MSGTFDHYQSHDVYAGFPQEHRQAGSAPVSFLRCAQGPFEATDPASHCFAFGVALGDRDARLDVDFGEGRRHLQQVEHCCYLNPTLADTRFVQEGISDLLFVTTPLSDLARLLEIEVAALNAAFRPLHDAVLPDALARDLSLAMWAEAARAGTQAGLFVDHALMTLALRLMQLGRGQGWRLGPGGEAVGALLHAPAPRLEDRRLARVVDHVEAHLDAPLTVAELAAVACLSRFHSGRAFRAATGESPHRYVMGRRVERAKAILLAHPALDLTSVAFDCGFASHSHLSEVFSARVGAPPGAWRREMAS